MCLPTNQMTSTARIQMYFKLVFNYLPGKCSPLCGTGVYWNAGKCLPSGRCLCFWGWTGPNAQYTTNNKILVGNRMGNISCTRRTDQSLAKSS